MLSEHQQNPAAYKSLDLNTHHKSTTILYTFAGMVQTRGNVKTPHLLILVPKLLWLHNKAGEEPGKQRLHFRHVYWLLHDETIAMHEYAAHAHALCYYEW